MKTEGEEKIERLRKGEERSRSSRDRETLEKEEEGKELEIGYKRRERRKCEERTGRDDG